MKKTCEFVSPRHPDKICDQIADAILDAYLASDPDSRVAVEVMGGHRLVNISGEVTSRGQIDIPEIVRRFVGQNYQVVSRIVQQSPDIAAGVDRGGAGDQGIMIGYACRETDTYMPLEYELSRSLCRSVFQVFPSDGKVQVTVRDGAPETVVVSFQNAPRAELEQHLKKARQEMGAPLSFLALSAHSELDGFTLGSEQDEAGGFVSQERLAAIGLSNYLAPQA